MNNINIKTKFEDFIIPSEFFVIYNNDNIVYHTTSKTAEIKILKDGFKTGHELGISEKRKSMYFSDIDTNGNMYVRNGESEIYEGNDVGQVKINLNGLKLLNLNYK